MRIFQWRVALAAFLGVVMCGCDASDSAGMPLSMYEGEVGEAVVRHLIDTVPDPSPGVPKSWSVVLGEVDRRGVFEPASVPFLQRFQDEGRRVISARVLGHAEPDNMIIDPERRVAVYVLQLRMMRQQSADQWEVEAAWSYKKSFQRLRYVVRKSEGAWRVENTELLEGNWEGEG